MKDECEYKVALLLSKVDPELLSKVTQEGSLKKNEQQKRIKPTLARFIPSAKDISASAVPKSPSAPSARAREPIDKNIYIDKVT